MKKIRDTQSCILLKNGAKLPYHNPRKTPREISLSEYIPEDYSCIEVEIGCGKGEFISQRARKYPDRFFIGIDRRKDRHTLTEKKLLRSEQKNWLILHEDARCFVESSLPKIQVLHVYHPDPWPKSKHHKHRFFRSPEALKWAMAIRKGGEFRISTDHREYFEEILKILETWDFLEQKYIYTKRSGTPMTHFEGIFLKKNEPVYKAIYLKVK